MKTGGTLNFLKRAGAILMLLAIFASSCNKYADDFKQINTKLDALATQVAGVTALSTSLTTLASQVTALQTAVAGLPNPTASIATLTTNLATANTNIGLIQTALANLATAVGTKASSVEVAKVTTDIKAELAKQLVALQAGIDNANLAILAVGAGQGNSDSLTVAFNKAIVANNTALVASIKLQTDALAAQIAALNTGTGVTNDQLAASIVALQTAVTAQKAILDQLLINTNMVNQDIYIASLTDMRYWLGKLSQIGIINGNVTINTTALIAVMDSVNMISSRITAVIGTQYLVAGGVSALSNHNVLINSTGTTSAKPLDLSRLYSVVGSYTVAGSLSDASVAGVDVSDNQLSTVGSYLTANYAGVYDFPKLSSVVGVLTLVNVLNTATPAVSQITGINVPGASASGLNDGINTTGTVSYPKALSIVLGKDVPITTSLTAVSAITVTLGATSFGTVLIDVPACTTLSIAATTVTALTINAAAACVPDLSLLASATGVGGLTITGPTTLNLLGAYTSGLLTSTTATKVNLPVHNWVLPSALVAVTDLTLGKVTTNVFANNYPTLKALAVTGIGTTKTAVAGWNELLLASVTTTASNTVLASVTLGGNLSSAVIRNNGKLTSLTASGIVNSLTIDGNTILAGPLTLHNTHFEGGPGSNLIVTNNVALTGLTSSTDKARYITISGNTAMTSLNLASYQAILEPGSTVDIVIGGNKLTGTYTAPTPATATTPLIEATIVSADLLTIKDYIAKLALEASNITLHVTANLWDSNGSTAGTPSLQSVMIDPGTYDNAWGNSIVDGTPGINSAAEFTLVQYP